MEARAAWGMNPEQVLTREALLNAAATYKSAEDYENHQLTILGKRARALGGRFINFCPKEKFCELGKKPHDLTARCEQFELTNVSDARATEYRKACTEVRRYFARLQKSERRIGTKTREV